MQRIRYVLPDPARTVKHPAIELKENQGFMWREHQVEQARQTVHRSRADSAEFASMANCAAIYLTLTHNYETFEPYWLHLRKGDVVRLVSNSSYAASQWVDVVTRDGHKARVPSTFCRVATMDGCVKKRKVSFDASMNVTIPPEPEEVSSREPSKPTPSCSGGYSKLMRRLESKGRAVVHTLRMSYSGKKQTQREEEGKETKQRYDRLNNVYSTSTPSLSTLSVSFTTEEFRKRYLGTVTVLYDFQSACEDEISVQAGQTVMLLNKEDADWVWVRRFDGEEGFVPANYTTKPVCMGCQQYLSSLRDIRCAEEEPSQWKQEQLQHQGRLQREVSRQQPICCHEQPLKNEDEISLLSSGLQFQTSPFMQSTLI